MMVTVALLLAVFAASAASAALMEFFVWLDTPPDVPAGPDAESGG